MTWFLQSLPFGGVKDSGFGRFAGVEGLRACCLVKSVVEDRWWPLIKTKIPKPIQVTFKYFQYKFMVDFFLLWTDYPCVCQFQYPIAENGFEFQESLVEALYGLNVWDRLRALVNVLKILTDKNSSSNKVRND